ncbi:hypothetical protein L3X37_14095 [Sabulilitoribacter arenilitoris]|uniref:Uncharacterized protein n=1 Tax=Wocania arenilitoris TaxID=2044858 RepID=A0AAE3JP92_9FLAO|nr:hypothetical protein [Wocania arenilitoris]MCF7569481.1 hypothetical protein [Wocania arenilitoris]
MKTEIRSYNDLLDFIKKDFVKSKEAITIVSKALNVYCLFDMSKDEVIKSTEYYIKTFCKDNNNERPLFLEQIGNDFNIKDIYKI